MLSVYCQIYQLYYQLLFRICFFFRLKEYHPCNSSAQDDQSYKIHWPSPYNSYTHNFENIRKKYYTQINEYVCLNQILSPSQSGFRNCYSTNSLLTNILDIIIRSRDEDKCTALLLLDFSKAFDTMNHSLFCATLAFLGFDVLTINFFTCYLKNRFQKVIFDNEDLYSGPVLSGVSQGSVLRPLLYLLYTFDIYTSIKYSTVHSFADDTQLEKNFSIHSVVAADEYLNQEFKTSIQYLIIQKT